MSSTYLLTPTVIWYLRFGINTKKMQHDGSPFFQAISKSIEPKQSVYLQKENVEHVFDDVLALEFPILKLGYVQVKNNTVVCPDTDDIAVQININIQYQWVNCKRASRYHLVIETDEEQVRIPCGIYDTMNINHLDKQFVLHLHRGERFHVRLEKDGRDLNDTIMIMKNSYILFKLI